MRISVIGSARGNDDILALAERVGNCLAARGHVLCCGGRGGVMAAACRSARAAGGETIGILPGTDPREANEYVDVPIVTGLGNARNVLVALNGAGVIAIGGRYGTLSEIAHACDAGRPVAGLETHDVEGVRSVETASAAVAYLENTVDADPFDSP